ncbi:MAG: family 10 glycosylhydrolase [Bacteroidota bacterium]
MNLTSKHKQIWLMAVFLPFAAAYFMNLGQEVSSQERELRGVWMATVLNIDYPSRPTPQAATLQAEMRAQLRRLKRLGFNAVFLQVRPAADALYQSDIVPWSKWLSGQQGVAPSSGFDPLAFAVDEAHQLGMELHAWLNPYRAAMSLDTLDLAGNHVFYQHPEWVVEYGDRRYLDPGIPAVQDHLLDVVDELVTKYPIDGIHFDDYFYPYPVIGQEFPDSVTYVRYGSQFADRGDWRRDNVNRLVARLHERIKQADPTIQFGISPFGIWRNQQDDPRGSLTRTQATSYDDLYGDALAWAESGTVDYLAPQLYWSIGYEAADYAHLLDWWTENTPENTRLLIGQAAYKVGNNHDTRWDNLEELPRQVNRNRASQRVSGSIYFSARSILQNEVGLDQRLSDMYAQPSLLPERSLVNRLRTTPPKPKVEKLKDSDRGPMVVWSVDKKLSKEELPLYYGIYRRPTGGNSWQLIDTTPFGQGCWRFHYYDESADPEETYEYQVRAIDRWHVSSHDEDEDLP